MMEKPTKGSKSYREALRISKYANVNGIVYSSAIRRHAKTHHRYCECECNGCTRDKLPSESWEQYDKNREEQIHWVEERKAKIEKLITKNAETIGLSVRFEGDPRGCTVRLFNKEDLAAIEPIWNQHLDSSSLGIGVDVW